MNSRSGTPTCGAAIPRPSDSLIARCMSATSSRMFSSMLTIACAFRRSTGSGYLTISRGALSVVKKCACEPGATAACGVSAEIFGASDFAEPLASFKLSRPAPALPSWRANALLSCERGVGIRRGGAAIYGSYFLLAFRSQIFAPADVARTDRMQGVLKWFSLTRTI